MGLASWREPVIRHEFVCERTVETWGDETTVGTEHGVEGGKLEAIPQSKA